jgi:hypothetical protein
MHSAQLEEVRAAARAAQEAATQAQAGSSAPRSGITAIQRPAGTAGRDFNIQKAMGLKDNKELYLGIQVSANVCVMVVVVVAGRKARWRKLNL